MRPIWIFLTLIGVLVVGLIHWRGNRSALEVWDDFSMGTNISVTNSIFVSNSVVENARVQWATNTIFVPALNVDYEYRLMPDLVALGKVGNVAVFAPRYPDQIPVPITTNMNSVLASNLWQRVLAKQADANEAYAEFIEKMVGK